MVSPLALLRRIEGITPISVCVEPPCPQVVWIVFGGYYVNQGNVPWPLRWLPSASLIKQGFQVRGGQNTVGRDGAGWSG